MEGNREDHDGARVLVLRIAQQPGAIPGSRDAASRRPKRARAGQWVLWGWGGPRAGEVTGVLSGAGGAELRGEEEGKEEEGELTCGSEQADSERGTGARSSERGYWLTSGPGL